MPILIRNWQWQRPLGRAGRQLQPRAGFAEAVLCLFAQLLAGNREGEKTVEYFFWLALPLSPSLSLSVCFLSRLSLSGFKSHFMGFCSFGTSSSFQICPGTFRAVPGMLRTRSVDYRDCPNERIQAVLVSRAGTGSSPCRCLSLPQCFLLPPSSLLSPSTSVSSREVSFR